MGVFPENPYSKPTYEQKVELSKIVKEVLEKHISQIVEREANEAAERVRKAIKEKTVSVCTTILETTNVRISKITDDLEIVINFRS